MRNRLLLLLVLITATLLFPASVLAQLSSCNAIHSYWNNMPSDPYTLIRDMKSAVEYLALDPSGCSIDEVERVRWTYANSLDRFSRTFPDDATATEKWAAQAVEQYQNYFEWFMSLDSQQVDDLVVIQRKVSRTAPNFRAVRLSWLRSRVGNVLVSLGHVFELTKSYSDLVDTYGKIAVTCAEQGSGTPCINVFPSELVARWHHWLKAMPDFAKQRTNSQIKSLLQSDDDYAREWAAFAGFLDNYIPANPSIKSQWEPLRKKVYSWLAT